MRVQSAEPVYTLQLKKEKRKEISRMDVLGSEPFFRPILPTDRKVTWGRGGGVYLCDDGVE